MYIKNFLDYAVLEETSKEALQALWIEIIEFLPGKTIISYFVPYHNPGQKRYQF